MSELTVTRMPAAAGVAWIRAGWSLFVQAPIQWTGMTALVFLTLMALSLIPLIGATFVQALSPFIVAGYLAASRAGSAGQTINFLFLAAGWREGRESMLVIGIVYMLGTVLTFTLVGFLTGGDLATLLRESQNPGALTPEQAERLMAGALPTLALGTLLFAPLLMATWFSPGLAMFERFPPVRAMWWSLWACLVNWRPVLTYSLLLGVIGLGAVLIPFGLGLLVFLPLTLTATYAAYRDIFQPVVADPLPARIEEATP
jgi:uncharacterized membrane protein